jgi:hypothetical protein
MLGPLKTELEEAEPSGAEQFDDLFNQLIASARGGYLPIVFFIDELDRAPTSVVVSVLQTLRTFLNQRNCVFIVAADQAVLEQALRNAEPSVPRQGNPYYSGGSAYLDKIFHYQFAIPAVQSARMTKFAVDLVTNLGGTWAIVKDELPYVMSLLIPDHVRSPRRAKTLLNNFVFAHRVSRSRPELQGLLKSPAGVRQLAKAVCLRTEFPLLYQDIEDEPDLADALTAVWADDAAAQDRFRGRPSLWRLVEGHIEGRGQLDVELGADDGQGARLRLDQLRDYLLRTREVSGPGRLLVYFESAASPTGLSPGVADDLESAARNADLEGSMKVYSSLPPIERGATLEFLARLVRSALGIEVRNVLRTLVGLAGSETDRALRTRSAALIWRAVAQGGASLLTAGDWSLLAAIVQFASDPVRREFDSALSHAATSDKDVLREGIGSFSMLTELGKSELRRLTLRWQADEPEAALRETLRLDEGPLTEFWSKNASALTDLLSEAGSDVDEVGAAIEILEGMTPAAAWGLIGIVASEATTAALDLRESQFAGIEAPANPKVQESVLTLLAAHRSGIASYSPLISDPVRVSRSSLSAAVAAVVEFGADQGGDEAASRDVLTKLAAFLEANPAAVAPTAAKLRALIGTLPTGANAGEVLGRRHKLLGVLGDQNPSAQGTWLEILAESVTAALGSAVLLQESGRQAVSTGIGRVVSGRTPVDALQGIADALREPRPTGAGPYDDSERIFDLIRVARSLDRAGHGIDVDAEFQLEFNGSGSHRYAAIAQYVTWKKPRPNSAPDLLQAAVRAAQAHSYSRSVLEPYFRDLSASDAKDLLRLCAESSMPVPSRVLIFLDKRDQRDWAVYLRRQMKEATNARSRLRILRYLNAAPATDSKARTTVARSLADIFPLNRTSFRLAATHLEAVLPGGLSKDERRILRAAVNRSNVSPAVLSGRAQRALAALGA